MFAYFIRRLILALLVVFGVMTITFCLIHIEVLNTPVNAVREIFGLEPVRLGLSDPVRLMMGQHGDVNTIELIREELGLNDPLFFNLGALKGGLSLSNLSRAVSDTWNHTQYFRYLQGLMRGDMGQTMRTHLDVSSEILTGLKYTAQLAVLSMVLGVMGGLVLGIASAVWQDSWIDRLSITTAIAGISAPVYLVGLIFILIFIEKYRWISGVGVDESLQPWLTLWVPSLVITPAFLLEFRLPTYLILPALTLGVRPMAVVARMTRTTMLEVIRQDYIRTARAKGLAEQVVILKHAVKNALIPVVTVVGLELAQLLTGAVLTESVFAFPGLGFKAWTALKDLDFYMIQGTVLFISCLYVMANLLVDLSYAYLDPRIRYS